MALPSASLPNQMPKWGDLKAAYLLFAEVEVTYKELTKPHFLNTYERASLQGQGYILFIQDTTEIDYTTRKCTQGLSHIGDGKGQGMLLHSTLVAIPGLVPKLLGLAAGKVWTRAKETRHGKETPTERTKRPTEGDNWAESLERIGRAPDVTSGTTWVSVGDRASDVFSYLVRAAALGWHCLLRVTQNRMIIDELGVTKKLKDYARSLNAQTEILHALRGRDGKPKREVLLSVAYAPVTLLMPKLKNPKNGENSIQAWAIRVFEPEPSKGTKAIEWILLSTLPVTTNEEAFTRVNWYRHRWLIEEYHKCLKSGCQVEKRQLKTADSLMALIGMLSVVAVFLLSLRNMSRELPDEPAIKYVPADVVKVIALRSQKSPEQLNVRQFFREVAMLGGFIGRKSDGDPGWQTIWKGWLRVQDMCEALQLASNKG